MKRNLPDMESPLELLSGAKMPRVGFGTWGGKSDAGTVAAAAANAILSNGSRSLDCAECYKNEKEIGDKLASDVFPTVKREELFITSKVWNTNHKREHVRAACERTLKHLQCTYLDLYLVHWPFAWKHTGPDLDPARPESSDGMAIMEGVPLRETWEAMEALVDAGLVKSIGVSNFNVQSLNDLLTYARIKPAVNQVELHPYLSQNGLRDYCKRAGIMLTAYAPLGRPGQHGDGPILLEDPVVVQIASRRSLTPGQVVLRWNLQRDFVSVIPKAATSSRQAENQAVMAESSKLTDEDMLELDALDRKHRFCNYTTWCGGASCFD